MQRAALLLFATAALGLLAAPVGAEEYWITYEGNDFPEDEGWTRTTYGGGAERSLEDGALVLDGREDNSIVDSYSMRRPIDPEAGELFIMRLRLRVDELTSGPWDPAFGVSSDESWSVGFQLSETRIFNIDDPDMSASFEPGVFHRFEVRSSDMRNFELRIDDSIALTGPFTHIVTASKVSWGDQTVGGASLSRWDYFEFGVVAEPASGALLGIGLLGRRCTR
jgi:hypothetical protein